MEESAAISLLKRGDIAGLERLVELHYVPTVRTVYLITRDRSYAEDIVQTAFLRVYERIAQFTDGAPFAPWFLRIAVNEALMTLRRNRRQDRGRAAPDDWDEVSTLPSTDPALDELLIAQETHEAIWSLLGRLTAGQRTVIVLRYYHGLSEAEMAVWLRCPPGTVKSRLNSARRRLRRLLPVWLVPLAEQEQ